MLADALIEVGDLDGFYCELWDAILVGFVVED